MTPLQTLPPHEKDLGDGFTVRRLLPAADRRAVGPFVFFDHFGPIALEPGAQHDVRPHPHIGLATLTYLLEGAILHRDSTLVVQRIEPGAVNWMSAGRGIVHSERTPKDLLGTRRRSHGLQLWIALPEDQEESAPSFQHVPADLIPEVPLPAGRARVLAGTAFGVSSPVRTASPTLAVALDLDLGTERGVALDPAAATERALYAVDHPIEVDGRKVDEFTMVILEPGSTPVLAAPRGGRVFLIGGEPLGHRFMSWNFVSSRRERILAAESDWRAQRFPSIPGETEFIPLPERRA
ncbi:MAG TPA: pirin family protein [Caldimonas sp.]|nr:pirin family protein [Caldimonas sp.]HEX2540830.1 pirin family protein [Caldimonas sp.]